MQLNSSQVAVSEKRLGMRANHFKIEPLQQIIRAISAAQAHHHPRLRIRKSCVQIGNALLGRSRKKQRPAPKRMLAESRLIPQRAQRLHSTVDALLPRKRRRRHHADRPPLRASLSSRISRSSLPSPRLAARNQRRRTGELQLRSRPVPLHNLRAARRHHAQRRTASVQRNRRRSRRRCSRPRRTSSAPLRARRSGSQSRPGSRCAQTPHWSGAENPDVRKSVAPCSATCCPSTANSALSTKITKCGLPVETSTPSTRTPPGIVTVRGANQAPPCP